MNRPILTAAVLLALACSQEADEVGKQRLFSRDGAATTTPATFDWSRPEAALALDAGEAARRLGSFDWTAAVVWTVTRDGEPPRQVHVAERHTIRHAASGEFEVVAELDPGDGEHARSGRHEIYAGGTTYAKSAHAPFGGFRERPTDRGRDAARHRDESFAMARDVARLVGPGLRLAPAGEATVLGRPARRFTIQLAKDAIIEPPTIPLGRATDDDTKRRLAFLEGRVPLAAEGELVADAETGVPLTVHLRATFGVAPSAGAPKVRAEIELRTQMRALGSTVAAITAPKGALPDERKPPGVSDALEAAGLKKSGAPEDGAAPAEPPDEGG
jgi:hypothetical protein